MAQVCARFHPFTGGIETHVREMATHLVKSAHGFEVEVLTTDPLGNLAAFEEADGLAVKRFRAFAPSDAYYLSASLGSYLRKHASDYDVIHVHGYHSFVPLHVATSIGAEPLIFTPHYLGAGSSQLTSMLHFPYRLVGRGVLLRSNRIISLSRYEKHLLVDHFRIEPDRISIVPNGVDLSQIASLQRNAKKHRSILSVSRLVKYKGLEVLIDAFSRIEEDARLEIVGEGPFLPRLLERVNNLGLRGRVFFYQRLPRAELLQRFIDADLFVLPSQHEAMPIALLEALASGITCVVARIPPLEEWIDNVACFGIDVPIDPERLASLICDLIGRTALNRRILSWDEVASKLEEIYLQEVKQDM